MTAALIIFAATYLIIAVRSPLHWISLDRPSGVLAGSVAMVAVGVLTLDEAFAAVSWNTIGLLLGMMIIAAYLVEAAFFRQTAYLVVTRMRSARTLLVAVVFVSGGLSALLVNDTVCLMFTPLVVAVIAEAGLPPLPYLVALASASNVGGVVTFTGNPQNMLIGEHARGTLSYLEYLRLTLPVGVVALTLDAFLLLWLFRRELPVGPLRERHPARPPFRPRLALKGVAALAIFIGLAAANVSLPGAALTAAAVLMLIGRIPPRQALHRVDWILLVFFAGLFIVVEGLARSGALELAFTRLEPVVGAGGTGALIALAVVTVIGSNVVSNVPFVAVALRWVGSMDEPRWGYIVLAVSSTLAGNLTLFGSVANLIVFESAGEAGKVSFVGFLRVGILVTTVTLAAAMAILLGERALGW